MVNIKDIKNDSILSTKEISDLVDKIFQVGVKKKFTETSIVPNEVVNGYYYDYSLIDIIEKEDYLGLSKENFTILILRWKKLNLEIKNLAEKRDGILDTDKLKYRENIKQRDSLWENISSFFNHNSISAYFTTSLNENSAKSIYKELIDNSYLDKKTSEKDFLYRLGIIDVPDSFNPLEWIKTNKITQGVNPSKISLLDFLSLIGVSEMEIRDLSLINSIFVIPKGGKFKANNYKKDKNNKFTSISEYHDELEKIVNKNK